MSAAKAYWLGLRDYTSVWSAMRSFTDTRTLETGNQIWFLEHHPVFTQGQAGKPEHVLQPGDIPIVASDRGGQVTYHGPGQLVVYPLLRLNDLRYGKGMGIRSLVSALEDAMIRCLSSYGITSSSIPDAPGVYVDGRKIGSIGLRVRKQACYHGISLNVAMDLEPFGRINPCGYKGLQVTQLSELHKPTELISVATTLHAAMGDCLGMDITTLEDRECDPLPINLNG